MIAINPGLRVVYGGDDGARTRDLCRDSKSETRNSLEPGVANGHFQRPEEPLVTLIGPLMDPRPLPCKPLPKASDLRTDPA
jgi:hypothetical protein